MTLFQLFDPFIPERVTAKLMNSSAIVSLEVLSVKYVNYANDCVCERILTWRC